MRIQHNIMAMNAYRNYNTNTSALSKNLEKLSSGYKINRAGDDAAGLAISEKMRAQITGLNAASKNVKDGISLVKTAEGAMQEIQDMLNRMDYLATQSANGTYDNEVDRANLQKEVDALKTEINRIADSANFNGIKLLDGSLDTTVKTADEQDITKITGALNIVADGQLGNDPQAGVFELDFTGFTGTVSEQTAGQDTSTVKVTVFGEEVTVGTYKVGAQVTGEDVAKAIAAHFTGDKTGATGTNTNGDFTADYGVKLTGEQNGAKVTLTMDKAPTKAWNVKAGADAKGFAFENVKKTPGGTGASDSYGNQSYGGQVRVLTQPVDSSAGREYAQAYIDLTKLPVEDGTTLTIGDSTYTFAVGKDSKFKDGENVIDLTDMASADMTDKTIAGLVANRITAAAKDNKNFTVTANSALGTAAQGQLFLTEKEGGVDTDNYKLEGTANKTNNVDGDWSGFIKVGKADTDNMGTALTLQIGDTSDSYNQMKVKVGDMHTKAMGIDGIDISNQTGASAAVQTIRDAINYVSGVRGDLGAVQNRLEHTQNNLSVMAENIQDAESTIRDTDVAEEMMSYVKNNILVQSAQAMLAQANQVPQGVLQLLG